MDHLLMWLWIVAAVGYACFEFWRWLRRKARKERAAADGPANPHGHSNKDVDDCGGDGADCGGDGGGSDGGGD